MGKRSALGGSHVDPVQERILSTFLNEMDGVIEMPQNVLVLAATNRPEAIDKAILRAGRFDHLIEIPLPDETGRLQILRLKCGLNSQDGSQMPGKKAVALGSNVQLEEIAKATPEFSGADLTNLIHEAGFIALRRGQSDCIVTNCLFHFTWFRVGTG